MTGLVLGGLVAVVAYFALGMPGMDHGLDEAMGDMDMTGLVELTPSAFAARADDAGVFVVNVHVPDEGAIAGTDAAIPYDSLVEDARLPADRATPVLLYCKTGRMSASAGQDLLDAGYTDVSHLSGGMDAWVASGRKLSRA